jgi:hypothetical protein
MYAKSGTAATGTPAITLNGNDTSVSLTTAYAIYVANVTSNAYPSNAATIGMLSTGAAATTFLADCGIMVAYAETPFWNSRG